ncbi:MAG TPA: RluA family pseudouridine synthase [Bacillota bacterium]|nr:RluA family pseudouridine synthase [Bacillota bacterium]
MKWTIDKKHEGMTVRHYLQNVRGFSRRLLRSIKHDGGFIKVNGKPEHLAFLLTAGDVLAVRFPEEKKGVYMQPEPVPLSIVYEDDAILVLNKPAKMATIPSRHHPTGTLANGILHHYKTNDIPYTIHVVTRLDRNTSGLVLVAKHKYSHSILSADQKAGGIRRKYQAIVEGDLAQPKGSICLPIGRKDGSIIERTVTQAGKKATTHYTTVRKTNEHTFVDIELETGRTHQIRVHFAHIGHPLAGDNLYGGSCQRINRQALHCCELILHHPITKKRLVFTSALPNDMAKLFA